MTAGKISISRMRIKTLADELPITSTTKFYLCGKDPRSDMKAVSSYLLIGLLYVLSLLPLWLLYLLSDLLYFVVFHVLKYRRDISMKNLEKSFPKLPQSELEYIQKNFYRHLCDVIVETVKALTMRASMIVRKCEIKDREILDDYLNEGRSVVAILGHYGNWEWAALSSALMFRQRMVVVYKRLSNGAFERLFRKMRTRFGLDVVSMKQVPRFYIKNKNSVFVACYVADQSPSTMRTAYWTEFLNQDTAVQMGPERIAIKYNHPVVFVYLEKVRRGRYVLRMKRLVDQPQECEPYEITEAHVRALEEQILNHPEYWLWTHRRWKKSRQPA